MDKLASKRPRTTRWTSGASTNNQPVLRLRLAPDQQQQQASRVVEPSARAARQPAEEPKIRLGDLPTCQLFALLQYPQAPVLPLPPAFPWLDAG